MGDPWTADYLKITGDLDVDLRSNIAAEARGKIVYERLINFTDDRGTIDAPQFLMTRGITHMKASMLALDSMGKNPLEIGQIPPTPELVNHYFDDSTGEGDFGGENIRGPSNNGNGWEFVEAPAFRELRNSSETRRPHGFGKKNNNPLSAGDARAGHERTKVNRRSIGTSGGSPI
jgi:Mn-containing catalase